MSLGGACGMTGTVHQLFSIRDELNKKVINYVMRSLHKVKMQCFPKLKAEGPRYRHTSDDSTLKYACFKM